MAGALLDTHAFYWLASKTDLLQDDALAAIGKSQAAGRLFVSAISVWELSLAVRKPSHRDTLQLGADVPTWFRTAVRSASAKVIAINEQIAIEAAEVPVATGHKDPGDCYIIATARVRKVPIITRDAVMLKLALNGYIDVIAC